MATCPRCGQFLGAHHECRGLWRLRLYVWVRIALGALGGAAVGTVMTIVVFGSAGLPSVLLSLAAGGVITWSFLRAFP